MSGKPYWSFNPQLPTVTGFLGAVTFTVMILLMESSSKFVYSEILIVWTGAVSFLLIVATLGGSTDQRNASSLTPQFINLVKGCYFLGFFGLMILIPAIVYSFSLIGAIVITIIEIIVYAIFVKYAPKSVDPNDKTGSG